MWCNISCIFRWNFTKRTYFNCKGEAYNSLPRTTLKHIGIIRAQSPDFQQSVTYAPEITFPADWTLENENHVLQIQNPAQNPDLDFVQQLADGTVRLSFDRSRLSTPLDYEYRQPLDASQFRSPINRLSFDRSRPSTPCRQPLDTYQFRSPIQPINQPS